MAAKEAKSKTESPLPTFKAQEKAYGGQPPKKSIEEIDKTNSPPARPPSSGGSTSVRV